jgi:hypothetical protein
MGWHKRSHNPDTDIAVCANPGTGNLVYEIQEISRNACEGQSQDFPRIARCRG